ncbi:hypothetical protein N7467_004988 [Penicillium canescens]|nr:hypothetical protein N7467_004988 [Penicillium canescens]
MNLLELISGISGATACLVLIALATIPSVLALKGCLSRGARLNRQFPLYEDEDGTATEESQASFSDSVPRYGILLWSLVGSVAALATALCVTVDPGFIGSIIPCFWFLFATALLGNFQALIIFNDKNSGRKATLGLYTSLTAVIIVVEIFLLIGSRELSRAGVPAYTALRWVQIVAALFQAISGMCLPRRPDVYVGGQRVDREHTGSILGQCSFAWAGEVMDLVKQKRHIGIKDLPVLEAKMRTGFVHDDLQHEREPARLWRTLFKTHYRKCLVQWLLVLIMCFSQLLPQFCLLRILQRLEARQDTYPSHVPLGAWVIGLGVSVIGNSWIENTMNWLSLGKIGLGVYEQLSALVVWKGMRLKDIKGDEQPEQDKQGKGSKHTPINLLAVDSQRVADFAATNHLAASSILKLALSFAFLSRLVGADCLAVGLTGFFLTAPFNMLCTRKYSKSQSQLMKIRDQKLAIVTEALLGIRQIKFSALEPEWYQKIKETRDQELRALRKTFRFMTGLVFVWVFGPVMLSAATLGAYVLLHGNLTASVAFVTISVFSNVEATLGLLPELTSKIVNAKISAKRIEDYLNSDELDNHVKHGDTIAFKEATVKWPALAPIANAFTLRNITLRFPNGQLSIISGKIGAGKSLLLASILGEADIVTGTVTAPHPPNHQKRFDEFATPMSWIIPSARAYVSQIPWIQNATVRENILFGLPYLAERYTQVMHACALVKDMDLFESGDQTDIGANGVNLSGGQKWRLAFARALYSRAGILILDDIFSALDAHVGKFIYDHALTGELGRGRTRILVTHHISLCLLQAEYCVFLADGTVELAGSKSDLCKKGILSDYARNKTADDSVAIQPRESPLQQRSASFNDTGKVNACPPLPSARFMADEKRQTGKVKWQVYGKYIKASGILSLGLVLLFFTAFVGSNFGRTWWLSLWTRRYEGQTLLPSLLSTETNQQTRLSTLRSAMADELWYYLGIYIALSGITCVLGTVRYYFLYRGSVQASRVLFERLSYVMLRMPLRWLDTVPIGSILNRLTADFNVLDSRLADSYGYVIYNVFVMIGTILAGLAVSPYIAFLVVVLLATSLRFGNRYLIGAREVKRLESISKSPILEQFGSALTGIGTVRAFQMSNAYVKKLHGHINDWARAYWYTMLFSRWLNLRLNISGTVFTTVTAAMVVSIPSIDAPLAGFCLSFVLQFSQTIIWVVRDFASLEIAMNALERISEYCDLTPETESGMDPPAAWPTNGHLEVSNLVVTYAPELGPVLKGLSFEVQRNERVGVVGRTGAGKSTLTLALFRFLEASEGSIYIDGIDVSKIKLRELRKRVAIIPQDPILFSGTVRSNLDPFDEYSDETLSDALNRVHLGRTGIQDGNNSTDGDGLHHALDLCSKVSQGGLNMSQGQRQLLCLARAIVSRPKIIALDEATSAVDKKTDRFIQGSIREEFKDSTLLVIAHRLSTVADFDKILVMGDGRVVEYDSPRVLINKEGGMLRDMIGHSDEKELILKTIGAR